MQELMEEL